MSGFIFYDTNYEWLAGAADTLETKSPKHEDRIVKIPILFDDFEMYKKQTKYEEWEEKAISKIKKMILWHFACTIFMANIDCRITASFFRRLRV